VTVSYEVIFTATAHRNLERLPPRIVAAIVEFAFGDLMRAPRRVGKPLRRQLEGSYSAGRGPYRIIYDVDDVVNRIEILRIDHRSDVYRNG
jgi:mRNA interferase RelE/StbE